MSIQQDQILFTGLIYLIFGLLLILNGRRILKNPHKVVPFPYWVVIKFYSIMKGEQGEIQKKNELLTLERVRRNAIYNFIGGILLSVAGILELVAIIIAN